MLNRQDFQTEYSFLDYFIKPGLKLRGKVHVFINKGPHITIFLNGHIGRLPGPMPCIGVDPDHHGILSLIHFLQGGSIFKGMSWNYPVVMISCCDQDSRVILIGRDVVERRVSQQVFELFGIFG